jgi:hypothetical protein
MTLTEFLLARIAEDEAAARAATPGPWRWDHTPAEGWGHQPPDLVTVAREERSYTLNNGEVRTYTAPVGTIISSWGHDADGVTVDDRDADHIALHNPARVLAECEAKRRIVEAHGPATTSGDYPCRCEYDDWSNENPDGPCDTLCHLATVYSDHPDYRDDWRP